MQNGRTNRSSRTASGGVSVLSTEQPVSPNDVSRETRRTTPVLFEYETSHRTPLVVQATSAEAPQEGLGPPIGTIGPIRWLAHHYPSARSQERGRGLEHSSRRPEAARHHRIERPCELGETGCLGRQGLNHRYPMADAQPAH